MSTLFGKPKRRKTTTTTTPSTISDNNDTLSKAQSVTLQAPPQNLKTTKTNNDDNNNNNNTLLTFTDLKLCPPLLRTCKSLGFKRPTPVQRAIIPTLLSSTSSHILALSATGSGKTAAFVLPILHTLSYDPYGIYAVILTPTRELAKQIQEQVLALGSGLKVKSTLVVGGMDQVKQSCEIDSRRPHFLVATPGRLAELLRGPNPPVLRNVRYMVLDEADRLLKPKSGFERDVAEVLLHGRRETCQTLLFSATMTRSLESLEEMAGAGCGRLPLTKFVIRDDGEVRVGGSHSEQKKKKKRKRDETSEGSSDDEDEDGTQEEEEEENEQLSIPKIPAGLRQEYVFMPSRVRDAYLITVIRTLMVNGGRRGSFEADDSFGNTGKKKTKKGNTNRNYQGSGWNDTGNINEEDNNDDNANNNQQGKMKKARSAIIFVSTCERSAHVSGILSELGVDNVSLHSLLSQNRRLAALGKFKSQQVRVLVATDVASRGLDVPSVDLVINAQLPRRAVDYIHRVGRTARAGRRGRAVSLVCETDVSLVHAAEEMSGRKMEKCQEVTDEDAVRLLGPVTKAARLTKMKLMDIGFDDLVKRQKERKARDRRERVRAERAANKVLKQMAKKKKESKVV